MAQDCERSTLDRPINTQLRPTIKLASVVVILFYVLVFWAGVDGAAQHDFVCYWTSAQLLRTHHNPYDSAAIWKIERCVGTVRSGPFVMRDPPLILPLIAPLGFFGLKIASSLWTLVIAGLFAISMKVARVPTLAWYFAPLLVCLIEGQITVILLASAILFFHFSESHPRTAGLFLPLLLIKPHLFILFWPILLLDCIRRRDFRYFHLAVPLILILLAIASALAPHAWPQYFAMLRAENIQMQVMPNVSSVARAMLLPGAFWMQVLPTCAGFVWVLIYFIIHRKSWNWEGRGPLLIAASVFVSPYSWYYDQSLFLPDFAQLAERDNRQLWMFFVMTICPVIVIALLQSFRTPVLALFGAAWLLWRLLHLHGKSGVTA